MSLHILVILISTSLLMTIPPRCLTSGLAPPSINIPSQQKTHYIADGDDFEMGCNSTGDPKPVYKWLRDGRRIYKETDRSGKTLISYDAMSGVLKIASYSTRWDGHYQCVAMSGDAASLSHLQTLKQTRLTKFKDLPPTQKTVVEYEYLMLECAGKGILIGPPGDINYNWYLSDKSKQVNNDDRRKFIDSQGNLHFTYVLKSDMTTPDQSYMCGYSSVIQKQTLIGNVNELIVTSVTDPQPRKPLKQYSNSNVQGILGSSVKLECFFSGYDPTKDDKLPTIKWFDDKDMEILPSRKFEFSKMNRVLTVKDLTSEDDKTFFCQGSTSAGKSDKMPVHLNVTSKPFTERKEDALNHQIKRENQTAIFNCNAKSLPNEMPPGAPFWFFNGKPVYSSLNRSRYIFSNNNKKLTIIRLKKPEDIQCIQCVVTNSIGILMQEACLNVIEPIVPLKRPPLIQEITKGDLISLTVDAKTDPYISKLKTKLSYEWTFNKMTYTVPNMPPHAHYDDVLKTAHIDTSHLNDEDFKALAGIYTCKIYHSYDAITIQTQVTLKYSASDDSDGNGLSIEVIFWITIAIILFLCLILIFFILKMKVKIRDVCSGKSDTREEGHTMPLEINSDGRPTDGNTIGETDKQSNIYDGIGEEYVILNEYLSISNPKDLHHREA